LTTPDFRALVRRRLSGAAGLDDDVIAELAAQLEDAYAAAVGRGGLEEEVLRGVEAEVFGRAESWHQLDSYLQSHGREGISFEHSRGVLAAADDAWRRWGRQVIRHVRRDVHFTTAVVLTLALCLGVAAALLTVVNAVLLRPLPFPDSDRVVLMAAREGVAGNLNGTVGIRSDIPSYFDRRQRLTVFEEMAMFRWIDIVLETDGVVQRVRGDIGTPSLLRLIGVKPMYGRWFEDGDGEPGAERKIVLSHSLWREVFAGNPDVVGTDVVVNGHPFVIVGVMPPDFGIFRLDARFWIPAVYSADERADDRRGWLNQYQIGRLRDGVSLEDARRELATFDASEVARFSSLRAPRARTGYHTTVELLHDVITRDVRPALTLLLVCSLLVVLIGLLNLATLTIARSRRYLGELATRRALGSGWRALTMQLLAESSIIGALGGAGALLLASVLLAILRRVGLQEIPRAEGLGLDGASVLVCAAAALLASGIIGLAPVAALAGVPLTEALRDGANERAPTPGGRHLRRGLVALQVAAAFVLTIGMGLTVVSLRNALSENPGFSSERVTTVSFDVPPVPYPAVVQVRDAVRGVLDTVHRLPGVEVAGVTQLLPFGGRTAALGVRRSSQARGQEITTWNYVVSPGYFAAMQVPLMAGRFLDERDTADAEPVIVIGRRLAQRLWPGGDAIGQQLVLPPLAAARPFTVVGVVGDVRQEKLLRVDEERGGAMYRPYMQADERSYALAVRSRYGSLDESELAAAIKASDPGLVPYDARPMQDRVDASLAPQRLVFVNTGLFAATTLLLATVGLYAALTYLVVERRREFGMRLVLGSSPRALAGVVMSEGLLTAIGGLVIGFIALRWLRPLLEPSLYAVGSLEAPIVAAAAVLVVMVSLLASLGPARHASRVDPLLIIKG
jgi:putative ABC transport system permease protein